MAETAPRSRRDIWVDLLLYPGHTLPTAAAPVIVASGLAIHDHIFAAMPVVLAFVGSWFIHIGGVLEDNRQLLVRHPAVEEHPELTEAVRNRTLTLSGLRIAVLACLGLAMLTAPYFIHIGGAAALLIGAIGAAASLGYAGGPAPYARAGLAEPVFLLMFGVIAVAGTYFAQVALALGSSATGFDALAAVPLRAYFLGLPVGFLVTNVLIIDDIRDRDFDAAKGWRTLTVRHGIHWSRVRYIVFSLAAYVMPLWFWLGLGLSAWLLLPLLTLPRAYSIARTVCVAGRREELFPMTPGASALAFMYAVLLGAGIALMPFASVR